MSRMRRAAEEPRQTVAKRPRLGKGTDAGTSQQRPTYEITLPSLSYDPADWLSKSSDPLAPSQGQDTSLEGDPDGSEGKGQTVTFDFIKRLLSAPLSDWVKESDPAQHKFCLVLSHFKEAYQDVKPWLADYDETTEGNGDHGNLLLAAAATVM